MKHTPTKPAGSEAGQAQESRVEISVKRPSGQHRLCAQSIDGTLGIIFILDMLNLITPCFKTKLKNLCSFLKYDFFFSTTKCSQIG